MLEPNTRKFCPQHPSVPTQYQSSPNAKVLADNYHGQSQTSLSSDSIFTNHTKKKKMVSPFADKEMRTTRGEVTIKKCYKFSKMKDHCELEIG